MARVMSGAKQARKLASNPSVRPWLLAAAGVVFIAMAFFSFRSLPEEGRSARPLIVLPLVLLAVPCTLALNALEYRAMATVLGHSVPFRSAARVSLAASLANYLPAPGGVAVRTAALKGRGSTLGSAVSVNAIAGLLWIGLAALATGSALMLTSSLVGRGALATVGGLGAVAGSAAWARRGRPEWRRGFGHLVLIEGGIVVVAGLRVWLALVAIGQPQGIGPAVAISSSTVIAAAVGIFPAGLGLREAVGGGLALAVGVAPGIAVAALAVDRVAGPLGMAICAPLLGLGRRGKEAGAEPGLPDGETGSRTVSAGPSS